jgi:polyphosphate kinase
VCSFRRVSTKAHLVYKPWKLTVHPRLHAPFKRRLYRQNWSGKKWKDVRSIFDVIRDGDLLVHHPYQSFSSSTQRFVEEAARVCPACLPDLEITPFLESLL